MSKHSQFAEEAEVAAPTAGRPRFLPGEPGYVAPFPEYGGMSMGDIARGIHLKGNSVDWEEAHARLCAAAEGIRRAPRPLALAPEPTAAETAAEIAGRRAALYAERTRRENLAPGENIGDKEVNAAVRKFRRAGKRVNWGDIPLMSVHIIRMNRGSHPTEDRPMTGEEADEWENPDAVDS